MRESRLTRFLPWCAAGLLAASSLLGCVGGLSVDQSPNADFAEYRTWAWLPPTPGDEHDDPELEAKLVRLLEARLIDRGYVLVDASGAPDFHLAYHVSVRHAVHLRSLPSGEEQFHTADSSGPGSFNISRPSALLEIPYESAVLVLGVSDPSTGELMWSVERREEVRGDFEEHLEAAIAEMMGHWPVAETTTTGS